MLPRPVSPPLLVPSTGLSLAPSKHPNSRFGEGYGDFAMKSSDNAVLYFPKNLLIDASPFFKDMFGIAEHAADSSLVDNTQPLDMEEDRATLEDLLLCINPSKAMPSINPNTIAKVFRAAHKYQIEKFFAYFAGVVGQESSCSCGVRNCGTSLSKRPTLVLSLAEQYDQLDLARLALRHLITEPMNTLLTSNPPISHKMLLHLLHLRKQRTGWFLAYIDRIDRFRHHSGSPQVCVACHTCLMTWTRNVHDNPSWSSIKKEIPKLENCAYRPPVFYDAIARDETTPDLKLWETEARELEKQLPELP